jgi:hypothetical protein
MVLVTTFSGEKNWSIISTGLLVGLTVISNRRRRERLRVIIFVFSAIRSVISPPPIPEPLRTRKQGIDGVLHVDGYARE